MFIIFPRIDGLKLMRIKGWFKETFRHHSLDEYREFFTRGMGDESGENRVYPWIYMRLLFLCLVMFGFTAFIIRLTSNGISVPTLMVLGAVLITAPFFVMLYELNPKKDLSFLKAVAVLVICSMIGDLIIFLGYFAWIPENEWMSVAWTAILEEFGKALPAILAVLLLKKRGSPMACLILAAAVGAGVSISEDLGYIFYGSGTFGIDLTEVLSTSILRAVTSVCTHVVWSAFIGWAFGTFKRPLIDIRFWGICIFSIALHFAWDATGIDIVPVGWAMLTLFICFVMAVVVTKIIITRERMKVLGGRLLEMPPAISAGVIDPTLAVNPVAMPVTADSEISGEDKMSETAAAAEAERDFGFASGITVSAPVAVKKANVVKAGLYHTANVALAVMLTVLAVLGIAFCYLQIGNYQKIKTFKRISEFKEFVQDGYEFDIQAGRAYDENWVNGNYYEELKEGKLLRATQKATFGDISYYYNYEFSTDKNGNESEKLASVSVGIGKYIYESRSVPAYNGYDDIAAYYFDSVYMVNSDVESCYFDDYENIFVVYLTETEFCGTEYIIALSVIAGLALISCGTVCIINYVKAGKEHD